MRPGDPLEIFDGCGRAFRAEIVTMSPTGAEIDVFEEITLRTESKLPVTLAIALSKGPRLDRVIEKATELGVARFVPFESERAIVTGRKSAGRVERWRRIAVSAAAQSGRTQAPIVDEVATFREVLAITLADGLSFLFWEESRSPLERWASPAPKNLLLVTGPEGGFSAAEAQEAERSGFRVVSLGPRILRADTAPIAATAICQWLWGDLG
jgi:16S rRNA (uracil1498-N3)-methyltransferase